MLSTELWLYSSINSVSVCGWWAPMCLISTNMSRCVYRWGDVFVWELNFFCRAVCFFSFCLYSNSVSQQLSETSSCLFFLSHITNTHTQWAAISDAPFSPLLFPPVAFLQSHLLWVLPILLTAVVTGRLRWRARWQGLLKEGWSFGFGHFVEEGEVCHILSWRRQGDDRGKLIAPEDLIGKIGCSNLAGSGGRLNRGTHDHQQLKICQLRVCPATTWRTHKTWGQTTNKKAPISKASHMFLICFFLFRQWFNSPHHSFNRVKHLKLITETAWKLIIHHSRT